MGAPQVPWSCGAEALLALPRNTAGAALRAQEPATGQDCAAC